MGVTAGAFEDAGGDDAEEESGDVGDTTGIDEPGLKAAADEKQRRNAGDAAEFGLPPGPIPSLIQR